MAVRKRASKSRRKKSVRTSTKPRAKTRSKAAHQIRRKRKAKDSEEVAGTGPAEANGHQAVGGNLGIRVRMYRVGFGDFFLVTVLGNDGPAHILIDCGVHAANIGSINECIQDLKKTTKNRLALVILTHYHADHMSGFASNYDDFANFDHIVALWITNRLDPDHPAASKFMVQLTSVPQQLQLRLRARNDRDGEEAKRKVFQTIGI